MSADICESGKKSRGRRARNKRKEERKEEMRVGPRDTKVVLVDQRFFDSLQLQKERPKTTVHLGNGAFTLSEAKQGTTYHPADFPDLSSSAVDSLPQPPLTSKWGARRDPFPRLQSVSKEEGQQQGGGDSDQQLSLPCPKYSEPCEIPNNVPESTQNEAVPVAISSKKKKSKGPIIIQVTSALKARQRTKERRNAVLCMKAKKAPVERLSGNILDASNPIRSRGKFREVKKKRLSNLKTGIIKDRIMKTLNNNPSDHVGSTVDFKREIEAYLEDWRKRRAAIREEVAIRLSAKSKKEPRDLEKTGEGVSVTKTRFSSKFRWYCENMLTTDLDAAVKILIQGVVQLQDRAFARDPQRAHMRKRHVTGFREVAKYLKLKKVKVLVVAPDLEASNTEGTVSKTIVNLKQDAAEMAIPCVFALNRHKLGYFSLKKVPVSVFAILSYDGLEERYKAMLDCFLKAKMLFLETFGQCDVKAYVDYDVTYNLLKRLNLSDEEQDSNPFLKSIMSHKEDGGAPPSEISEII